MTPNPSLTLTPDLHTSPSLGAPASAHAPLGRTQQLVLTHRQPTNRRRPLRLSSTTPLPLQMAAAVPVAAAAYDVGDRVRVIVQTEEELKRLQEGHGGWNQRMARFIGKVGTIHRTTENGDLRVKFEDSQIRWTFNPVALVKIPTFAVGETVRVIDDIDRVKELQVNHGEWVDQMRHALGRKGRVAIVYRDNDLRVTMLEGMPGTTYTLNPYCVTFVAPAPTTNPLTVADSLTVPATTTTTTAAANTNASPESILNHHPLQQQQPSQGQLQQQQHQHHVCASDDVISSSSHRLLHPSPATTAAVTTSSSSSPHLMPASGDEVNRTSGPGTSSTTEISDLLRQVQLRDTKFKCSRGDGGTGNAGPHSADAALMSNSSTGSACPALVPDGQHHQQHQQHQHAMHRSPASRHSHSSPLVMATTSTGGLVTGQHHHMQQHHSSPSARHPPQQQHQVIDAESVGMETVEMLKCKIAAIEDMITCNICMEKMKNVAFLCGHGSCFTCAQSLTSCHMCRLPITARINLY